MGVVDLDDYRPEPRPTAVCDRCRLDVPADDLVVVEFTELEEAWCSTCRDDVERGRRGW